MKEVRHDTKWMVSVALMAAIVIVLANTPLGMIQLPIIKATTVHIPVILGAILLGPSAGAVLGAVFDSFIFCLFSLYEYNRAFRGGKGAMDISRLQDVNWHCVRMAFYSAWQIKSKPVNCPSDSRFYWFHGEYGGGYGKYLSSLCTAVC